MFELRSAISDADDQRVGEALLVVADVDLADDRASARARAPAPATCAAGRRRSRGAAAVAAVRIVGSAGRGGGDVLVVLFHHGVRVVVHRYLSFGLRPPACGHAPAASRVAADLRSVCLLSSVFYLLFINARPSPEVRSAARRTRGARCRTRARPTNPHAARRATARARRSSTGSTGSRRPPGRLPTPSRHPVSRALGESARSTFDNRSAPAARISDSGLATAPATAVTLGCTRTDASRNASTGLPRTTSSSTVIT